MLIITNLHRNYVNSKINTSYLSKYVSNIDYSELTNTILELNSNSFIYLSYEGNEEIYNFEKRLRKTIKQYDLEDNFIYVNCSTVINEDSTISSLKNILSTGNSNIILPAIIYFKDNEPIDYIDSLEGLLSIGSFQQLLDKYELEGSN